METIYGCGSNHFSQLTIAANCDDSDDKLQCHDCYKIPVPLHKLSETETLLKSAFTWSRFIATFQTGDSVVTHVSGFTAPKDSSLHSDPAHDSIVASPLKYPDKMITAVTDADIYMCCQRDSLPSHILKDGDSEIIPVHIEKDKDEEILVTAAAGGHKDLYLAYDELSFGKVSVARETNTDHEESNTKNLSLTLQLFPIDSGLSISFVSCGKEHALLLSKHGTVYSYGLGSRGQLGHGTVEKEPTPRLIEALEGLKVKTLSAGGWHSAAVAEAGDLYTWGWNESGQLGHPALSLSSERGSRRTSISEDDVVGIQAEPRCAFDLTTEQNISHVSCGSRHTLCLTESGKVFASGWNAYGQLGLGHLNPVDKFTLVDKIKGTCTRILAAQWNSLFVCKV
ncbi:ultraviolet-B receptor UVR8-like [Aplysia californica]|uniref:Ultraviolet-B receptor UVR8-like n=1 Tax=Aplysia californica TaxID=6500 RepID=A0ABM1VUF2_APLCA|nr:ultraviolet-B receptor UVR8-like [Aplysia californica]